jgi:anti-sigma regulatory factor (Ser/Thr protein kinase)
VDEAAAEFGLGPADRYQFVFAVNEAVTNAIRHGRPDSDGTIGLRLAVDGNTLICSVNDRGQLLASAGDADPLAEGSRGLTFMALMTDEVELLSEDEGTTVRLHKRRSASRVESRE